MKFDTFQDNELDNMFLILLLIFALSVTLVYFFCKYALQKGLLDIPNARSSHTTITPRGGGTVFVLLWLALFVIGLLFNRFTLREAGLFIPGVMMVSLVGYWDDKHHLSAKSRFLVQIMAATYSIFMMGGIDRFVIWNSSSLHLGILGSLLAGLAIIWSTNLLNFMDGLDGLAAVEALFVLGMGGFLFFHKGHNDIALLAWGLASAVAGFLVWNWPKAIIFMGDVGSYCLGFLIALFAILGNKLYGIPVGLWIILYGAFWFDATLTLLRRFLKGENITSAHQKHAYQRLYLKGFSQKQILLGLIALNTVLACITLWIIKHPNHLGWGLGLSLAILSMVYLSIECIYPMFGIKDKKCL